MSGGYNLERLNFLVVEDNKHMRALVKTILVALGAGGVVEAADGADGFRELRNFPADIVICDWSMAPMDGLDFVRLVRTGRDSPNPFVAIIMLTGHAEIHRMLEARDAGVHEFLAKPISARGLYSRIRAIIEQPRAFARTATYFGPDRRRRQIDHPGPDRRRGPSSTSPQAAPSDLGAAYNEAQPPLAQGEINALLNG